MILILLFYVADFRACAGSIALCNDDVIQRQVVHAAYM